MSTRILICSSPKKLDKNIWGGISDEGMDAVKCVITIQKLAKKYPWFSTCSRDVRMLRIEDNNDLLPAIR